MPQTSQEILEYMEKHHGEDFDDNRAIHLLKSRGYTVTDKHDWIAPSHITEENMPEDDKKLLIYLIEEWDFGGVIYQNK